MTGLPPQERSWEDLLEPPSDPGRAVDEARRALGLPVPLRAGTGERPDTSGLLEALRGDGHL